MAEGNTELNSRSALVIPNGFVIGEAAGEGDCFFDSVAQGINELCILGGPFDVKLLRQDCFNYADCNQGCIYDTQSHKTWRQAIEEDVVAGKYATNNRQEQEYFYTYMANIGLTAAESSSAIWGRPGIEGRMLCQKYGIKIHIIENFHSSGQEVIGHHLVDSSGSRSLDEHSSPYNDPQIIHILNEGLYHFVPILRKTSVPNKPVEKEARLSPSEDVQSQNNPKDRLTLHPVKSVAASSQKVCLLVAQPEHLEQGPEKADSTYKAKTHQTIDVRYLKECSLTDTSTWCAVAAEKENADFKILRITNSPTVSAALDFMQQAEFYETFNQASHWFFIVIEVDDGSEFSSKAVDCLAEVLDEKKHVIIQWDLMCSAKHFVFFRKPGHCAFTPLEVDSDSLSTNETELTDQLSKEGSFELPLLLNSLRLHIGGHSQGDTLDLLKVSFDVNQEIKGWRLIDYAARDDDSLSLRLLLLADWDLARQNGDGRRTLEIAAEYGGRQSLSALLNLPIASSAEEHFLSNKEKELLALRNDLGDNPLLIAAKKGRPETLQFLICCGTDILCHRQGNEMVTAIALAWDEECYENVRSLLEADCPFPVEFDLNDIGKRENMAALMKQVEDRQSFHEAIRVGSQDDVEAFITTNPRLKQAYDPSNQSALMTALKAGQYELYALLQSEGFSAGTDEQLTEVLEGLTREQRQRLKQAKLKYFGKQDDSHIIYLLSKSRLGFGQENKKDFGIIRDLYIQLDAIPEISTILKVVEHSEGTEIIFDFSRNSIIDLDPTHSYGTAGACDYKEGRIYVGAKEQSQLLGTLAHELTHLAMQVCYNNLCNPYEALDEQKKCAFDKIVAQCRDKTGIDNIIKFVFMLYKQSCWPAELIVRVPHLLAHYSGEQDKQLLTQQVPELFSFYEQHTQEDLKRYMENPARFKARHKIQRLNTLLQKMVEIEQSKIWLNDECLLNDDVIDCQHIWILSSPLPLLTTLNLYQVLRRKRVSLSDIKSDYIFISAEEFKNREKAEAIYLAFQSVTHPTLIIDCSYEYDRSETDLWSTLNSFSEKRRIIFIAVTDVAQSLQDKLKNYQAKMMHDREYTWSDLTPDSQNELLKNTICFQGSPVSLNELISVESSVTKFLPLADLLEKRTLEIGKPLLTSTTDGYIENYYIPRTFNHQVAIKKDIFEQKFSDLVATNEQEYTKYCQDNPERNVHRLLKDKSGRLIWQQSQGSLRALRRYIDTQNPLPYPPENLDEFLQQAQCQKVMLIADTAGMGKTTVLTHLSKQIKQKFPTKWVVKIDLNDHTEVLEAQMKQKIGNNEFLSEKLLKFDHPFEKELFKQCCQGLEEATKVIMMFDGLDEISPKYKETVLDLLQDLNPLKQPWIEQLWVTTRPHLREELEDHLQQLCYTLEPFSEDNQVGFLTKFCHQHLKLEEGNQQELETYARALIKKLAQSISDKEKEFTGIPLQTRMLAEAFEEEVQTFCLSQKSEPGLPKELCLVGLYRKFIENKWNIFIEKGEIAKEQQAHIVIHDISVAKNHQKLALEILFPELKDTVSKLEKSQLLVPEAISRIGIVQYINDKFHFIHRTFAEYYVADFLVTQLASKDCFLLEVQNFLLKILLEEDYHVIRFFLDELLSEQPEVNLQQFGEQINRRRKGTKIHLQSSVPARVLHQAIVEGSAHIIRFLFDSLKAAKHSDTIKKLLQYKDRYRKTVWHLAAESCHIETLEELWVWAKKVHLNNIHDLLLAKDEDEQTAWHIAADDGEKEILEKLWCWATEVPLNLKVDLLLAKNEGGQTAWHLAANNGHEEILEKIWSWGTELELNLKNDLLLAQDKYGETAWNVAARNGKGVILEKLWLLGSNVRLNFKNDLLLAKDRYGQTAWNTAARHGNKEILEKMWSWGKAVQLNLKNELLLAKDRYGDTAWHIAARRGYKETLEKVWDWAREVELNLKKDLLLAEAKDGETAWHSAARYGYKEILEKLWDWAREMQLNLKNDLLLAQDKVGRTAYHVAKQFGYREILEKLHGWASEFELNLSDNLLLANDDYGQTAWNMSVAAEDGF
jgi:ankyrin repeat protein